MIDARSLVSALVVAVVVAVFPAGQASAHCDSVDGPVVTEAREALQAGDVTPLLKWVPAKDEPAIREAFEQTLAVRQESEAARDLADRFFFETLVRIHRLSEGAPFTGLLPAGTPIDPGIVKADQALATGNVDDLAREIAEAADHTIRAQFARTREAQSRKEESVAAGREYVSEYVKFVHYVKHLHASIAAGPDAHGHESPGLDEQAEHVAEHVD